MKECITAKTSTATVRGFRRADVCQFNAIRYAAPPVGALRFSPPVTMALEGDVDATQPNVVAPQLRSRLADVTGDFDAPQSEDCLRLTVWTPELDDNKRPVVVWLHGGAWQSGGGALDWYEGSRLCAEGDVVVVSVNYRLAMLGWLCVPGEAANVGLLDCELAIEWVRANIGAFGGDPANVTVMGQSAGGNSIACLLARQPMFQRAIIQSASLGRGFRTRAQAEVIGHALLEAAGVSSLAAARELPLRTLLQAQNAPGVLTAHEADGSGRSLFCPVLDGDVLPEDFAADIAAAPGKVDVLIGATEDEMSAFPSMTRDEASRNIGKRVFIAPAADWANAARKFGRNAWLYRVAYAPTERFGACHCIELPFVFGSVHAFSGAPMLVGMTSADEERLHASIFHAWLRFIRGESPGWAQAPALQILS